MVDNKLNKTELRAAAKRKLNASVYVKARRSCADKKLKKTGEVWHCDMGDSAKIVLEEDKHGGLEIRRQC